MGDVGQETKTVEPARNQRRVPIEFLKPNPRNPRRNFAETELDELKVRRSFLRSSEYQQEFERLMTDLARANRDIRARIKS